MATNILKLPTQSRKQTSSVDAAPKKPLTALAVKNHKVGILADTHPYQGLRLRANANGTKTWTYRYRFGDKLKQIKLGTWPGMELAEARTAFLSQRKLREANRDPRSVAVAERAKRHAAENESVKSIYTFGDMVEDYLTERVEKDRQLKGARETRRLLEGDLGNLKSASVSESNGPLLHNHILNIAERAPDVARVFRQELRRAWQFAINVGRTDKACLINTDMGGKLTQGKRERSLDAKEVSQLLPWLRNYSDTVADALALVLHLGLRSGEVCKLRDEWLHQWEDGLWIVIPKAEMKRQHSDHWVPLVGRALEIANRRKGSGYWFSSRVGGHIAQKVLGVEVYAYSGRSKAKIYSDKAVCPVKDWAPNDLRKTARSHLAALGCPFEVAESVLHHKVPGVGGLYNQHKYLNEKREWLNELSKHYQTLTNFNDFG
jgi:integrase